MSRPVVEFENAECIKETDLAILVVIDGEEYWIPRSQMSDESDVYGEGQSGTLIITEWIAEQKGLI
jgi:hypothetical protein